MMANQHVIDDELTKKDEEILIKYENEKRQLKIVLNKEERIIICFKKILNIDLTVVEIIPKDSIDESYFLLPNFNYEKKIKHLLNKDIQILQFPWGKKLSLSQGKILKLKGSKFYHSASTNFGSF